jgi:peptidoglycan/xylan/chitin deacetylase (PgdA/CDA1 family)
VVQRAVVNLAAGTLPHMPGRFSIARMLGPSYSIRCVLFHDVSDTESPFTRGLGITIRPRDFEAALRFLTKHYTPVRLQDVLKNADSRALPPRPVLVTFDDAYASVLQIAAPLCIKFGVPAIFFVNGACLDNTQLAIDNLVCYVANVAGLETINAAVRAIDDAPVPEVHSLSEVFTHLLPAISLPAREAFRNALVRLSRINERDIASEAELYLTSRQLRHLATLDFEIGNHTYTHVNCRCLRPEDFSQEIDGNKKVLEEISGTQVLSFSVPYGSSIDLTPNLVAHLQNSGHHAAFLVESLANRSCTDRFRLDRVSVKARSESGLFSEIEVLPRLRVIRNRLAGTKPNLQHQLSQPMQ